MYLFSRIATSSTVLLGTGGLLLFLLPASLGGASSQLLDSLYKSSLSSLASVDLEELRTKEEEDIEKLLQPLFEKFKRAFEYSTEESKKENETFQVLFKTVENLEEELKNLYEKNKENFKSLNDSSEKLSEFIQNQLKIDANFKLLTNSLELLKKLDGGLDQWKKPISELISALDENQNNGSSTSGGGEGEKAKTTLKEVRERFQNLKQSIEGDQVTIADLKESIYNKRWATLTEWFGIKAKILIWEWSIKNWKSRIEEVSKSSSSTTSQLNKNYEKLKDSNNKREEWKRLLIEFYKYRSELFTSICSKNFVTASAEKSICKTL